MPYCFVDKRDGSDTEPDCPVGIDWLLLAHVPDAGWGLYELVTDSGMCDRMVHTEPVGDALTRLIDSGKRYPPALALAAEEVVEVLAGETPDRFEFTTAYSAAIRAYLERQVDAPFQLVPALADGESGLRRGEWYWLLQIAGTPPVASWVCDRYRVRDAPASGFDLTGQQLRRLASV